jgi:co-chaperonin GroES (HSP10)
MLIIPKNKIAVIPIYDPSDWGTDHALRPGSKVILHGEEVTAGEIVTLQKLDESKERCDQGIIKYVGSDSREHGFEIGQYVFFSGYTGTLVQLAGEGRLIMLPYRNVDFIIPEPENITVHGLYLRVVTPSGYAYQEGVNYETILQMVADEFSRLEIALPVKQRSKETEFEKERNVW